MKKIALFLLLVIVFVLGWGFNTAYAVLFNQNLEAQLPFNFNSNETFSLTAGPKDHVVEDGIHVYKKGIVLDIENSTWSKFTDTHSMEPVINKNSNGIEIEPNSENDISIGDIISYNSEYADGLIIHRVIAKGHDEKGGYFIVKGDNLKTPDPGKIRFDQIHGLLVAVVY
jgi:hypothetical protein